MTVNGKTIQAKMRREREAKIAVERKRIEAADKARFAEADRQAEIERRRVKDETTARQRAEKEKEAMVKAAVGKPAATKAEARHTVDDNQLAVIVAKQLAKGEIETAGALVKAIRQSGTSASQERIKALFLKLHKNGRKRSK